MNAHQKKFLTTKEVVKLYGLSRQTLDRREQEGKISKYRFGDSGRKLFWNRTEIENLFTKES